MPTNKNSNVDAGVTLVGTPLSMRDLAAVLVKHYGIHEGKFDLFIEFQIGTGPVGPTPDTITPGVLIGFSKVGLVPSKTDASITVDAAVINPIRKTRRKKG